MPASLATEMTESGLVLNHLKSYKRDPINVIANLLMEPVGHKPIRVTKSAAVITKITEVIAKQPVSNCYNITDNKAQKMSVSGQRARRLSAREISGIIRNFDFARGYSSESCRSGLIIWG